MPDVLGNQDLAAQMAHTDADLHQIYERYFGPV
jgi:hypothetical protein